jgi:hypothetical protein
MELRKVTGESKFVNFSCLSSLSLSWFPNIKFLSCLATLGAGFRRFHSLRSIAERLPDCLCSRSFDHGYNTEVGDKACFDAGSPAQTPDPGTQ